SSSSDIPPISGTNIQNAGVSQFRGTFMIANINDRNSPNNGQLVRVMSENIGGKYTVKQLTGLSINTQYLLESSKLQNIKQVNSDTIETELKLADRTNEKADSISGSGSS